MPLDRSHYLRRGIGQRGRNLRGHFLTTQNLSSRPNNYRGYGTYIYIHIHTYTDVRWLFGCGLVGLLVVLIVPLLLPFLAIPGLCCFLRVTYTDIHIYADIYRYMQICTAIYRYIQIYTDVYRCIQIYTDIYRDTQIYTDIQIYTDKYRYAHTHMRRRPGPRPPPIALPCCGCSPAFFLPYRLPL